MTSSVGLSTSLTLILWIFSSILSSCLSFQDLQTLGRNEEAQIKDSVDHMRQLLGENHKAMGNMVVAMKSMQVSKIVLEILQKYYYDIMHSYCWWCYNALSDAYVVPLFSKRVRCVGVMKDNYQKKCFVAFVLWHIVWNMKHTRYEILSKCTFNRRSR